MNRSVRKLICIALLAGFVYTSGGICLGQNLDSLLANKRVYYSQNIGKADLPKIDGNLNDEVWMLGDWQGDFTQQQPIGGVKGSEQTKVKVLYDFNNLYVAIICNDSEPQLIREYFDRRDAVSGDMAGIAIDSYYDKRTAFEFNLSAAGQKMDVKHLGDYQFDYNWNAVWDGASSRNDSSWTAELRIPFSQLRYTNKDSHIWGMHVWRWISRKFEEDQWQYIPREAPAMVYLFGKLEGIDSIRSSRQMEFLPYALSSLEINDEGDGFNPVRLNAGIDSKMGIGSGFTLDLSINPDFGQVEADPSVLNLSSFETFYEEKRSFFLEGNEVFDFEMDGDIPYYSRRIGSVTEASRSTGISGLKEIPGITTILGAAKLTGKTAGGLSIGVVNGLTNRIIAERETEGGETEEIQLAPFSNFLSSRIKKEMSEGNLIVGGIFSIVNRFSTDTFTASLMPSRAISGGVDMIKYWDNRNYYLGLNAIASNLYGSKESILKKQLSHTHRFQRADADYLAVDSAMRMLDGHGALLGFGKKGGNLNFNIKGQYRSPGLNLNDIGYIRKADFAGESLDMSYQMNTPGKWVRNYRIKVFQDSRWSFGGEHISNLIGSSFTLMNNKLWTFNLNYKHSFSHLDTRELRGGPAIRIDDESELGMTISSNRTKRMYFRLFAGYGRFNVRESTRKQLGGELTWIPFRKLKLSAISSIEDRLYHQQYISSLSLNDETLYITGTIDQSSLSFTFRGELFLSPALSLQYYGSPWFSGADYSAFSQVLDAGAKDVDKRLHKIDASYNEADNRYLFSNEGTNYIFANPDFSFIQFRSNLVFRWEYNLGSTLYLVWAHNKTSWESVYKSSIDLTNDLFGFRGSHILMFKLNIWFSI